MFNLPAVLAVVVGVLITYTAYHRSIYRRTIKRRTQDLGAELRAEQASLRAVIEALPGQIDLARRSRTAAAAAPGAEGLQRWLAELDRDLSEVELLRSQIPTSDSGDRSLSDVDTEIQLVEVLALSLRASALAEKCRASIAVRAADRETFVDDVQAPRPDDADARATSQYCANDSRSPIVESVV